PRRGERQRRRRYARRGRRCAGLGHSAPATAAPPPVPRRRRAPPAPAGAGPPLPPPASARRQGRKTLWGRPGAGGTPASRGARGAGPESGPARGGAYPGRVSPRRHAPRRKGGRSQQNDTDPDALTLRVTGGQRRETGPDGEWVTR